MRGWRKILIPRGCFSVLHAHLLCSILLLAGCGEGTDQEATGRTVTLAWDANREHDLAGYKIYYGQSSRNYTQQVNVGNVTTYTVSGLESGKT